jgi:glycosyltransferase involved in cell wall biosynthesis
MTQRRFLAPDPEQVIMPGPVPTFSVVIPAYQAAEYIGRAVDSVLAQTVPPLEIIVSDDGSTDDLAGALSPYNGQVRLLSGPNGGPQAARNRGFRAASGEFVVNLDADDILYPEWLEAVAELGAARPDLDILTTNGFRVRNGRRLRRWYDDDWPFEIGDQRREVLRRNLILGFAAIRRARFLEVGGFDERIVTAWDLWLRLILSGSRAGCVDEALFEYRAREGSLSTLRGCRPDGTVRVLEKALTMDLAANESEEIAIRLRSARSHWERDTLHLELASGRPDVRRRAFHLALKGGYGVLPRLKMLAAAVAPGLAGRVVRAIDRAQAARSAREWDER